MSRLPPEAAEAAEAEGAALGREQGRDGDAERRIASVLDAITRTRVQKAASEPPRPAEGANRRVLPP
jgi:hypothetical protein